MIDTFTIFFIGGKVLWNKTFLPLQGNPINKLIKTVLLEERSGEKEFTTDAYKLQWSLANEFNLVFVVVYQKLIQLLYVDELLQQVKEAFCTAYNDSISGSKHTKNIVYDFDDKFMAILRGVERQFERETQRPPKPIKEASGSKAAQATVPIPVDDDECVISEGSEPESPTFGQAPQPSSPVKARKAKPAPKGKRPGKAGPKSTPKPPSKRGPKKPSEGWKADLTVGDDGGHSGPVSNEVMPDEVVEDMKKKQNIDKDVDKDFVDAWAQEQDEIEAKKKKGGWGFGSMFSSLQGKTLEDKDLDPLLANMKERLIGKNVGVEIAEKLCESVSANLKGTSIGKFSSIDKRIREVMKEALARILTPKEERNILREIERAREEENRPYVIVFCGVNGVGKSTNLAKIAFWLKNNDKKVMLAACDTFRAGAIEQLGRHAQCLDLPLFQKGYNKDAASIAHDAITKAQSEGCDVVLVDTAGRMQDNEPLMRSLVKLVTVNNPDMVLFVGEALVGNDAVDQLSKFNSCLRDMSKMTHPHTIDGIVLTKFDTIDDKVGASVSMVYTTGQPVVFVGVGQTYTDLRKLDVSVVVDALLAA
eukprot:TRINITY_DN103298_c0_g1_i1.p1 TRINITY_DN103298_c0_g1~~TRINITY_DN103298_c0_g1_i1.p1  ORF type:complete len:590 (-),score=124.53 TRINITY_DN103298_c0_g1_i1:806-2575(-)